MLVALIRIFAVILHGCWIFCDLMEGERSDFLTMVMRMFVNTRGAAFLFMSLGLNKSDFPRIMCPSQIIYKWLAIFNSVSREVEHLGSI